MRDLVDLYVRSLAEREDASDAPEHRQDLGTFLDWLLEQRGFIVHMHSYKRDGVARLKSSGDKQWGVDLLATKQDADGQDCVYLFVLKQGDIGKSEWAAGVSGRLQQDLWAAAERSPQIDKWFSPEPISWKKRTVVVVHNGELDKTDLGSQIDTAIKNIKAQYSVDVEWWDADRLVDLAMKSEEAVLDGSLLPPAARPFIRMALDSLKRAPNGRGFDIDAVDRYLEQLLPGTAQLEKEGHTPPLLRLRRQLSELALAASIIIEQCRREANNTSLPALDTLERMICRGMVWLQRLPSDQTDAVIAEAAKPPSRWTKGHAGRVLKAWQSLIDQYVWVATGLSVKLAPISNIENGLALALPSERIDYPIRVLRLSGYLAISAQILYEQNKVTEASQIANVLKALWETNASGALNPIIDDQIIEIWLVFELWLNLGMRTEIAKFAYDMFKRFLQRQALAAPFPAIWMRAEIPINEKDLRTLVEAHYTSLENRPATFIDDSSTILPLLIYVLRKCEIAVADDELRTFIGSRDEDAEYRREISAQGWSPPRTIAAHWYGHSVSDQGDCYSFNLGISPFLRPSSNVSVADMLVNEFEEAGKDSLEESLAQKMKLPALDRIAWKRWRTPPPLNIFVDKLRNISGKNP